MKVYRTLKKGFSGLGFFGMVTMLMMSLCTKDNPTQPEIRDNWNITGNVQDGYTGAFLDSAQVVYTDRNGNLKTIFTTAGGSFACPNLPYGAVTVSFKYTKGTGKYTTTVLDIASGPKGDALTKGKDSMEFKFRDTAVVVKLYAMSGSVNGTLQTRVHERAAAVVGAGLTVKVTFSDSSDVSMKYASPRTFTAVAGADGRFTIDSLPLASNAVLTVLSGTVGGVDFAQKKISIPDLAKGGSVSMGTIVVDVPVAELDASSMFRLLYTNFPTRQILPNGPMTWTLSNAIDSAASYAVLQAAGSSGAIQKIACSGSGNAFSVTPSAALIDGDTYVITAFIYGKTGGKVVTSDSVTVKSASTEVVVASNVLTATKQGIEGLGLADSMAFTLAQNIKDASVSVSHGTAPKVVDLVTTTIADNKIVIKPKGSWLAATPYTVLVAGTLADGTPLYFEVTVSTEGSLNFATSNVFDPLNLGTGKNGFIVTDTIIITANKPLAAANAILTEGANNIPVSVNVNQARITILPKTTLNFATSYTLQITMTSVGGEVKQGSASFTTISSSYYMVSSNACIGGDAAKSVIDFDPASAINVEMSEAVGTVSAVLKLADVTIPVNTAIKADEPGRTIVITPTPDALLNGQSYSVNVVTSSKSGVRTVITLNFTTRTALYPVSSNVRISNDPTKPVLNFDPLDNVVIVMSKNLAKATAQMASYTVAVVAGVTTTTATTINTSISIKSGDSVVIHPEQPLDPSKTYFVNISVEDTSGIKYSTTGTTVQAASSSFVWGLIPVNGIFVVASNVLTKDFISLTNVPITVIPWFKLSVAPVASSITATITTTAGARTVQHTVSVNGDTIFLKPAYGFGYGEVVTIGFSGMAINGKSISVSGKQFTCELEKKIFVVASNMVDANGDPVKNFARFGEMWIKFSEQLSTDKNLYDWSAYDDNKDLLWISTSNALADPADVNITGEGKAATPNATVRIGGDTLFVKPDNRQLIDFSKTVGFTVKIQTASGNTQSFSGCVKTLPLNLFVKATNTKDVDGAIRTNFGFRDTFWVVPNTQLDSIIGVTDLVAGGAIPDAGANILRSRVRLAATGDTIFYVPSIALDAGTVYGMNFDVHVKGRPNGENNTGVLAMTWKTKAGVEITSINLLNGVGAYRPFKVIGDSVVVSFSKAVDTAWNAPTRFAVNNFVTNYTKRWSSDLKTVTIKNLDTLDARTYSTNVADYSTDLGSNPANLTLTFDVTCSDGEKKSALAGGGTNSFVPPVAIKTEYKLALVGSNTVLNHTTTDAIATTENPNDTVPLTSNLTLVFSRAVDSARIKADAASQYQNFIQLVVLGSNVPLEFAISFSSDAKTVTLNPVANLVAGTEYDIKISNIPAIGLKNANTFSGTGNLGSILAQGIKSSARDFKAIPAGAIIITALRDSIAVDTMPNVAPFYLGNKVGYTPGDATAPAQQADGSFKVRIQKTAWNASYYDSVTSYQARVRNSQSSNWYILTTAIPRGTDFDVFDPTNSTSRRWNNQTVNVAADAAVFANLQVPDGGASYSNNAKMLNDSTVVEIQIRPVKDNTGTNSYGQWSNSLFFADNVAPGDSDYVANVGLAKNFGGAGAFNPSVGANDSSNYVTITFPEDMDITTTPTIAFYQGVGTGMTAPTAAGNSGWTNARTYNFYIKLIGGNDYRFATSGWYFRVSTAGMKDYSGVALQASGTLPVPTAASGTTFAAVGGTTASTRGNNQVGDNSDGKYGYFVFP